MIEGTTGKRTRPVSRDEAADSTRKLVRVKFLERAVVGDDVGGDTVDGGHGGQ